MSIVTRDVKSIAKSGSAKLKGDVTLSESTNITLTQSGQDISIAASGSADGAIFKYRIVGSTADSYFGTSNFGATASTGNNITANTIIAHPFITSQAITIDRIAIEVTSAAAAGNTARLGIYNDNGSLYPGTLLLDAGTVATDSTGVKTITISQALSANTLYWLAANASVTTNVRVVSPAAGVAILGLPSSDFSVASRNMYYVSSAYAALPTPYPSSATITSSSNPLFVRILS